MPDDSQGWQREAKPSTNHSQKVPRMNEITVAGVKGARMTGMWDLITHYVTHKASRKAPRSLHKTPDLSYGG